MNLIPIITAAISAFKDSPTGQKKIPGFSQNVGELLTSKTNMLVSSPAIGYGITILSSDPHDKIGHAYLLLGIGLAFLRDTSFKKTP